MQRNIGEVHTNPGLSKALEVSYSILSAELTSYGLDKWAVRWVEKWLCHQVQTMQEVQMLASFEGQRWHQSLWAPLLMTRKMGQSSQIIQNREQAIHVSSRAAAQRVPTRKLGWQEPYAAQQKQK